MRPCSSALIWNENGCRLSPFHPFRAAASRSGFPCHETEVLTRSPWNPEDNQRRQQLAVKLAPGHLDTWTPGQPTRTSLCSHLHE